MTAFAPAQCPSCAAYVRVPENVIAHAPDCPLAGQEDLRRKIGALYAIGFYGPNEPASKRAFDAIAAGPTYGLGFYRFCTPDRRRWFVAVVGEREDTIRGARQIILREGGRIITPEHLPGGPGMLDGLRIARWRKVVEDAQRGQRRRFTIRYGRRGAQLDSLGLMHPIGGGQG